MRGLWVAAFVACYGAPAAAESAGLRWSGDARVATTPRGGFSLGPALRFRYGVRAQRRPASDDSLADLVIGSWFGAELSAGVLAGMPTPQRYGASALIGGRLWASRRQDNWFLANERWSLLGLLLPEAGLCFGFGSARWYLGWDLPVGAHSFQFAPGVVWLAPGQHEPVLLTFALRVPM